MDDFMLADGKYPIVIGVVLIILIGLFFYMSRIDKKLSRAEKSLKELENSKN